MPCAVIELHTSFLESNLLFQVRALPNPSYTAPASTQASQIHAVTIHLSPTSTANVIVTSLAPPQSSSVPFAKIAPDGEVIVAPKNRPRLPENDRTASRSIVSTGRRSAGGMSAIGTTRQRSHRETPIRTAIFLRAVDRTVCDGFLEAGEEPFDRSFHLAIYVDSDVLADKALRGTAWVCVSVVRPAGLELPLDPQQQQKIKDVEASESGRPTSKVVAKILVWEDAPDTRHAALSSALCSALEADGTVGGLIRIEAAPQRTPKSDLGTMRIFPLGYNNGEAQGLKFGGQTQAAREAAADRIRALYASESEEHPGILDGPITDGLILPKIVDTGFWEGGIVRFRGALTESRDPSKPPVWCLGSDVKFNIEVMKEIASPLGLYKTSLTDADALPAEAPSLISIDSLAKELILHLSHSSSVLLCGGLGSGKSTLACLLALRLRSENLYYTTYFSCSKLMTDETRISTIKDTFNRLLMSASWGTRLGGHAIVVLDDLDKLCPAETELQTSDNGRSRQVSELLCSLTRRYCGAESNIVILATAKAKEAINNVVIGGNIFKEIIVLKAPDKDGRRQVLEALTGQKIGRKPLTNGFNGNSASISHEDEAAWMAESTGSEPNDIPEKFGVDRHLDFLDLAGQTDGYMPGDLTLLVSRARNEALIRSVGADPDDESKLWLTTQDFQRALEGFTPASLRNVTLQTSKTTFDSIGGMHETRKILLETLQYPTTYAPIFAQCPLRLRSGLLLYGYPGCGKTLLASAIASECGLNFISVKGPEILNKYIGASEKSVRDLFDRAESARPCVLFFDEFDSIAPKRGHDSTGVTDRVVNQLLTQMDGAEGLSGVYVLAATSRPDLIDPALLRPGRLDKSLLCDMPNFDDRLDILQALRRKLTISPQILNGTNPHQNLNEIAHRTVGYSGADLQAVIYNAHLEAIHDVLGDHQHTPSEANAINGRSRKDPKKPSRASKQDILQFRFGTDAHPTGPVNSAKQAAEHAAIIAKLDDLKLVRRKERQARRGPMTSPGAETRDADGKSVQRVVIQWEHVEASLNTTRSSISVDERRRLERIYREFVVGRNGEMPDGQGPTDVGGRSSLM